MKTPDHPQTPNKDAVHRHVTFGWWGLFAMTALPLACSFGAPGVLDATFGSAGKVVTPIRSGDDQAWGLAIQSDGKILLAGFSSDGTFNDFALARYNPSGSLDTTFSTDGKVTTDVGTSNSAARGIAVQPDGKIVVVGSAGFDFAVVRYSPNGNLDATFSSDGKATTSFGAGTDVGYAVAIQSDGRIVVAGYSDNGTDNDFAAARFNADGTLDTSFSGDGKVRTSVGGGDDKAWGVALQSDGKIVLAGHSHNGNDYDFAVVRFHPDGTLDNGFSSDGKTVTEVGSFGDFGTCLAIQPNGQILVAGHYSNGTNDDFAVVRYNGDGSLDSTFDADGIANASIGSGNDRAAIQFGLQPDGKILVGGYIDNAGQNDFGLARFNSNGALDTSFGVAGKVITPVANGDDIAFCVALQSDGKIVLGGWAANGSDDDFAIVRYEGLTDYEKWRLTHFGTYSNTGNATDTFDFDGDGLANLAEFGLGLIPTSGVSCQLPPAQRMGNDFVTIFNTPAGVSGIIYGAEWSPTLAPNSWTPIPNTGTAPQNVFSVPIGSNAQMFMRLKVTNP